MSYQEESAAIQEQINELHQKKAELLKRHTTEARERLKDIGWLRGQEVDYVAGSIAAGLPSHQLVFRSEEKLLKDAALEYGQHVVLWGNHRLYEYNVVLRPKDCWGSGFIERDIYTLDTSSTTALCEFIEASGVKIKIGDNQVLVYRTLLEHRSK